MHTGYLIGVFATCATLVVYTYVGYPLVLFLMAGNKNPRGNPDKTKGVPPSLSIYVAAFNEAKCIGKKLENLTSLDYPNLLEVVVADDGSTDETAKIVDNFPDERVSLVRSNVNIGKTAMQCHIVPRLKGEIVVLTDATSSLPKDALGQIARYFVNEDVGVVAVDVSFTAESAEEVAPTQGLYWRYERMIRDLSSRIKTGIVASGTCYALRRSLFQELPNHIAEDLGTPLLVAISGKRVIFAPEICVTETGATSVSQEFSMRRRIALQNICAARYFLKRICMAPAFVKFQFFSHKLLRCYAWIALAILFISSFLLRAEGAFFFTAYILQAVFYSAAIFGLFLEKIVRTPVLLKFPLYFSILNFAYAWASVDHIRGRSAEKWQTRR